MGTGTLTDAANGLLAKAARDAQSVYALCSGLAKTSPYVLPGQVSDAVSVVSGGGSASAPVLDYDSTDGNKGVDDYLGIPIESSGNFGQPPGAIVIRRSKCYQAMDVSLRLHFGMQTFQFAQRSYNVDLWDLFRNTDEWQTIRIGLHIYFDLLRIGLTAARVYYMTQLANSVTSAYGSQFLLLAPEVAGSPTGPARDTVVPISVPGLDSPCGILQPLVVAIENVYQNMRDARQKMTARLPLPPIFQPDNSDASYQWPCSNCVMPSPTPTPTPASAPTVDYYSVTQLEAGPNAQIVVSDNPKGQGGG